jgi:hypothetical protein
MTETVAAPAREEHDAVYLTFVSDDGAETYYGGFTVDDYDRRVADGGLDSYLKQRGYPKIAEAWRPDFHEVERKVVRMVRRDGKWGPDPGRPERRMKQQTRSEQ